MNRTVVKTTTHHCAPSAPDSSLTTKLDYANLPVVAGGLNHFQCAHSGLGRLRLREAT